jgi:hypothetical protein
MPVHRIHLKGPWEFAWLGAENSHGANVATSGRVQMPCEWRSIFGDRGGRGRFSRRFHRPTGLEPGDVVRIVFAGIGGAATIGLNGEPLIPRREGTTSPTPEPDSLACDVSLLLQPANRLVVEVEFDPGLNTDARGGLWGPVAIEIVSS